MAEKRQERGGVGWGERRENRAEETKHKRKYEEAPTKRRPSAAVYGVGTLLKLFSKVPPPLSHFQLSL